MAPFDVNRMYSAHVAVDGGMALVSVLITQALIVLQDPRAQDYDVNHYLDNFWTTILLRKKKTVPNLKTPFCPFSII